MQLRIAWQFELAMLDTLDAWLRRLADEEMKDLEDIKASREEALIDEEMEQWPEN